jgi:hypothetical protein
MPIPPRIKALLVLLPGLWWWLRRSRRPLRPVQVLEGGVLALVVPGDRLLLAGFARNAPPERRLAQFRAATLPGEGRESWTTDAVLLSPNEAFCAVSQTEYVAGGDVDFALSFYRTADAVSLLFLTDNSARPSTIFRGDDPSAPPVLARAQAFADEDWREFVVDDPSLPRPILTAQFFEATGLMDFGFHGWLAEGAVMTGRCALEIRQDDRTWVEGDNRNRFEFWARAGPGPAGDWDILERGAGPLPARLLPLPRGTPTRPVSLGAAVGSSGASTLLIDGVVQTHPEFSTGIFGFDGPFSR